MGLSALLFILLQVLVLAALRAEVQLVAVLLDEIDIPTLRRQSKDFPTPAAYSLPAVKIFQAFIHSHSCPPHQAEVTRMAAFLMVLPSLRKSRRM
jgi:hypothetical protein